jgi:hypothetical protein
MTPPPAKSANNSPLGVACRISPLTVYGDSGWEAVAARSTASASGSRQVSPIINLHEPRMPADRAYLFFPMFSRCQRLFAFGASPDQHDHSDYDIFVALANPETLELRGNPVRYTFNKATDRYPDVFLADFELGTRNGEVPFEIDFASAKNPGEWKWDFGDGSPAGKKSKHTFSRPGEYDILATQGSKNLRGHVPHFLVDAEPVKLSKVPTLKEIASYREGLMVGEYRVKKVVEGQLEAQTVRVAHWALHDGVARTPTNRKPGWHGRLDLESFEANPRRRSLFLSDTLEDKFEAALYYDPSI